MSNEELQETETADAPEEDISEDITEQPETAEDVARAGGWKPLDEWNGDAKEWRSAEVFNERGDWIKKHKDQEQRINAIESSFNQRLDGVNKLHKVQLDSQRMELSRKRDEAIGDADVETANAYQGQIDDINKQSVEQAPVDQGSAAVDAWNSANPWITGDSPKASYARDRFAFHQRNGMSDSQAISKMEADVARAVPDVNPSREKHPTAEGGSKPGKKRAARKLTMADLTREEALFYKAMPGSWPTEAAFLQAVQDDRSREQ